MDLRIGMMCIVFGLLIGCANANDRRVPSLENFYTTPTLPTDSTKAATIAATT